MAHTLAEQIEHTVARAQALHAHLRTHPHDWAARAALVASGRRQQALYRGLQEIDPVQAHVLWWRVIIPGRRAARQ